MNTQQFQTAQDERVILGSIIIDNDALLDVASVLTPADFSKPAHQLLFGAMLELYLGGHPIDLVTAVESLQAHGQLNDAGGIPYIASLPDAVDVVLHGNLVALAEKVMAAKRAE